MRCREKGVISVFLALSLIIILSMILSMLEAARYSARNGYSSILLRTAAESVMGEFYGPLFKDYHLYGIDTGFGTRQRDIEELEKKISAYIPENVWDFVLTDCNVTKYSLLMENGGSDYLNQMYEYEKYAVAPLAAEAFLEKINLISDCGKLTKVYERASAIESELSKIDECTLELMRYIDGVHITTSLLLNSSSYKILNGFVKRMWIVKENEKAGMPVNNPELFESLKEYYINPIPSLNELQKYLPEYIKQVQEWNKYKNQLETYYFEIRNLETQISEIEKDISLAEESIDKLNSDKSVVNSSSKTKKQKNKEIKEIDSKITIQKNLIKAYEKEIDELNNSIDEIKASIESVDKEAAKTNPNDEDKFKYINGRLLVLRSVVEETKNSLYEVEKVLNSVAIKRNEIYPQVLEYSEYLKNEVEINPDIKQELEESLDLMKAYVGIRTGAEMPVDYDAIGITTRSDLAVLNMISVPLLKLNNNTDINELQQILDNLDTVGKVFNSFSYEGMFFDYSDLIKNESVKDYGGMFGGWITSGILGIILGGEYDISTAVMKSGALPSKFYELVTKNENLQLTIGGSNLDCLELLSRVQKDNSNIAGVSSVMEGFAGDIVKEILTELYYQSHFKCFGNNESKGDSVLEYELEYIISGTSLDSLNFSNVAMKILLIRFAISAIYAFTSQAVKGAAASASALIFGVTCLPFLIKSAEKLIIAVWAFAQAIIETAAILKGKNVPLITNDQSFCLTIFELPFLLGLIQSKVEKINESSALAMGYDEYLLLFLFLQDRQVKAARSMDIIQENIRYRYNDDFLLFNCITGFSVEADFMIEPKFDSLMNKYISSGNFISNHAIITDSFHY